MNAKWQRSYVSIFGRFKVVTEGVELFQLRRINTIELLAYREIFDKVAY